MQNTMGIARARTGVSATNEELGQRVAEEQYPSEIPVGTSP